MLRSLKSRLTALYVGIFAIFLVVIAGLFQFSLRVRAYGDFDQELDRDAHIFARLVVDALSERDAAGRTDGAWQDDLRDLAAVQHAAAALFDGSGRRLFATADFDASTGATFQSIRFPLGDSRYALTLTFIRSTSGVRNYVAWRFEIWLVTIPIVTALSAVAGYLFVRRALRPVDEMAALARAISAGDLKRRIPLPTSEGELRTLAETLNGMLARLDEGFERMRSFSSASAHELRTPIQTMRAALESSLEKPRAELADAVADTLEELGVLSEVVEKLLLLARADARRLLTVSQPVDLDELARQVVDALHVSASTRNMRLTLRAERVRVNGDAALLRRAIHNLVDNAVKYGRDGGSVIVTVAGSGVEVVDDGPGIAPEHQSRLFDRFFRADPARSDRVPGSGLGLAIVKSIAEAHGGSVTAESAPGRTRLRIVLTAAASDDPVPAAR